MTANTGVRTWDRLDGAAGHAELVVDRIACDGYGMCAELLPELIDLDDWGYPIMRVGGVPVREVLRLFCGRRRLIRNLAVRDGSQVGRRPASYLPDPVEIARH